MRAVPMPRGVRALPPLLLLLTLRSASALKLFTPDALNATALEAHKVCCVFELHPPAAGDATGAARVRARDCEPANMCGANVVTLAPGNFSDEFGASLPAPQPLTMRILMVPGCAFDPALVRAVHREPTLPPLTALLPPGVSWCARQRRARAAPRSCGRHPTDCTPP